MKFEKLINIKWVCAIVTVTILEDDTFIIGDFMGKITFFRINKIEENEYNCTELIDKEIEINSKIK